ncbi:hypothetical protein BBJ28_00017844 [Nothophytophthora sp. Chile5]|nr:hypothetical protein BBJ28_00017844 [Nothophytophthora sp. Chile5]
MTALQIDVLRICLQKMRPMPLLRSRWVDVESPVALAIFNRKLVRDRSTYRDIDTSILDLLLAHNASVNNRSEYGLIKHVEKLVAAGADVHVRDQNGRSVLDIAGEHGFVDVINVLVQNYPDLVGIDGVKSEMALIMAVRHEFVGVLEVLYDRVLHAVSPGDALAVQTWTF